MNGAVLLTRFFPLFALFTAFSGPSDLCPPREDMARIAHFGEVSQPCQPGPEQSGFQSQWGRRAPQEAAAQPARALKPRPATRLHRELMDWPSVSSQALLEKPGGFWGWLGLGGSDMEATQQWAGPRRPIGSGSLWERPASLLSRLKEKPSPALVEVARASPDQAAAAGREDYERRVTGLNQGRDSSQEEAVVVGESSDLRDAPGDAKGLYVAVELDLSETGGDIRDAVAQLTQTAGLNVDSRFNAALSPEDPNRLQVSGWIPQNRFSELLSLPALRKVGLEPWPRERVLDADAQLEMIIHVKASDSMSPERAALLAARRLSVTARLRSARILGQGSDTESRVALVQGRFPSKMLRVVLADPDVVKITPVPGRVSAIVPQPSMLKRSWGLIASPFTGLVVALGLLVWRRWEREGRR